MEFFNQNLDFSFTSLTKWDKLAMKSEWHRELLMDIFNNLKSVSKTSYQDQYDKSLKSQIATYVNFLISQYELDYFFKHIETISIESLIEKYVSTRTIKNQNVKSALKSHSASQPVCDFVHFLKIGLQNYITLKSDINQARIVKNLENKRIAADASVPRAFTDEEVNAMFEVVKEDKAFTLILTIFREIGLRISSLLHLTFNDMFDENDEPRSLCKVKEKKQTIREFVTSKNLQQKLKQYVDSLNLLATDNKEHLYLFYPSGRASKKMISESFKRIAYEAGIQTNVHPHAFRHTLVSKLIAEGNSIEIVSKFIGHSSSKMTEQHYYVPTIQQLTNNIKNPFMEDYHRKRHIEQSDELELQVLKKQKQLSRELLFVFNTIIATSAQHGLSAKDIQSQIFTKLPNLGNLLVELE